MASLGFGDATRETLSVTGGGITFTVVAYDDGRNKPYRLKFSQDGSRSLYTFDSDTIVTNLKVGTEKYKVRWPLPVAFHQGKPVERLHPAYLVIALKPGIRT